MDRDAWRKEGEITIIYGVEKGMEGKGPHSPAKAFFATSLCEGEGERGHSMFTSSMKLGKHRGKKKKRLRRCLSFNLHT